MKTREITMAAAIVCAQFCHAQVWEYEVAHVEKDGCIYSCRYNGTNEAIEDGTTRRAYLVDASAHVGGTYVVPQYVSADVATGQKDEDGNTIYATEQFRFFGMSITNKYSGISGISSIQFPNDSFIYSAGGGYGLTNLHVYASETMIQHVSLGGAYGVDSASSSFAPRSWYLYLSSTHEPITGLTLSGCDINSHVGPYKQPNEGTPLYIKEYAFSGCQNLKHVQIDGDIEEVGKYAFQGASCLEAFTVNGSVRYIERGAFQGCGKLSTLDLGETIGIGRYAFKDCKALESIRIPEGASVGNYAFAGCSNVRTLYLPNSAASNNAFWDCQINEATMPGRYLARELFGKENARRNLKTVSIAPGSERILGFGCESYNNSRWIDATVGGDGYSCTNLVSVTIPPSVTNIAMTAFNGCSSLKEVNISDFAAWCKMDIKSNPLCITKRLTLNGQDIQNAVIPESVKRIGFGAFYNCDFFESIEIPETVEEVGPYAFHGCPNLRAIPPTIKNIGEFAFQNCTGLTEVVIPNGTKKLSRCIFDGCSGLESVTLPDGLEVIDGAAFYGCTNLFSIAIPDSVTNIETSAFANCSRLKTIKLPNGQLLRTHVPFSGCNNVETVDIPQSWHEIPQQCFSGMRGLVTMAIPGNIETVGGSSFWCCYALKQVTLGDGIKNIEEQAFSDCTNIVSLVIPCTVTNIGWNAFSNCSSLERIHLPRLFEGNTGDMGLSENCEIVFYDRSTPAMDVATGEVSVPYDWIKSFFPDIANEAATIQNVANAIAANGVNKVWECYVAGISPTDEASKFKARIEMVDGKAVVKWTPDLNEDGAKAVREYRVLGKRTLDAGEDWTDVTNVADLEAAGFRFFRVSVDLIDSFEDRPLWTIEDGVLVGMEFNGTDVDVVIPDGVIAIADEAFAGMNELRSIVIPESVEYIGRRAFAGCEKLLAVKIEGALCDYDIEDLYSGTPSELVTFATGIWDGPTEIWCERTLVIEGGQSLDASDANIVITSEGGIQPALPDDSLEVWVGGIPSLP